MTVEKLETEVSRLTPGELVRFRHWFEDFWADLVDRDLEKRVAAGEFDAMAEEASKDFREGRCTEL